jgi:integrase
MNLNKRPLNAERQSTEHPITGGRGLTIDECRALYNAPRKLPLKVTKFQILMLLRAEILIRLLYETWARINELLHVNIEDIDFNECAIHIKFPKGKAVFKVIDGKRTHIKTVYLPRWVFFSEDTRDLIIRYLEGRRKGPLILSNRKRRFSVREAERIVNHFAEVAGIQKVIGHRSDNKVIRLVTCKSLREAGERHTDIAGADRDATARIAGHTVRTKEAYYKKGNFEEDRAIVRAHHPLMNDKKKERDQM